MFAHVAEDVHDQQQEEARDRGSGHAGLDLGPEPFLVLAESSPLGFRPPKSGQSISNFTDVLLLKKESQIVSNTVFSAVIY